MFLLRSPYLHLSLAEAVRFRRRRKPDYPLWAALLLPMLSMLFYIPLIRAYGGHLFAIQPSYQQRSFSSSKRLFGGPIMVIRPAWHLLLIPLRRKTSEPGSPGSQRKRSPYSLCMFLSPILLNLAPDASPAECFTTDIVCHRRWQSSWLSLSFLPYRVRLNRLGRLCRLGYYCYLALLDKFRSGIRLRSIPPRSECGLSWHPLARPTDRCWRRAGIYGDESYENAAVLSRLYYLKDQQASLQFAHTNYFQDFEAPDVLKKAGFPFTANIAPYSGFCSTAQAFFCSAAQLSDIGSSQSSYRMELRLHTYADYGDTMPYSETTLFLVTMPLQTRKGIRTTAGDLSTERFP